MINRRRFVVSAAASATVVAAGPASAQPAAWPSRFVRLVVPFTPGGGIDAIGRIVGAKLSEMWGQQVVVDNKPGAGGNIASEFVARAEPDGHTLYITAAGLVVNQFLFASVSYNPAADFAPVTLLCLFPNLLIVPNGSAFRSVADLIAHARDNPGKLTFGTPGHGTSPHMSGELFKHLAKVNLTHVPYRGAAGALSDLVAGRIDMSFAVMASGLPLARGGQARALGVTTATRSPIAPEVPTIAEAGVAGYDMSSWFAFVVPAKTPPAIIARMHADTVTALADPAVKKRLDDLGVVTVGSSPAELAAHLKAETERWGPVIRAAGIRVSE
jgi:tripartite-type tricarboxylate transporter receptor subunit TctC